MALPSQVTTNEALIMACIAGMLICVLAWVLAWQYSGFRDAGAYAFLFLIFSPLIFKLSREASGTIWALVFAMSGLACLQWSASFPPRRRWTIGLFAGVLIGYAFTCHFNIAPFILGSFLAGGIFCVQKWQRDPLVTPSNWFRLYLQAVAPAAIGSLAVLALIEIATQIVDYRLRNVFPEYRSFFGELRHFFVRDQVPMLGGVLYGDGVIGWGAEAWLYYGRAILREGSQVFLILITLSYVIIFHRKIISILGPSLILFIIPVLFYATYVYRVERVLGMCLTAGYIIRDS